MTTQTPEEIRRDIERTRYELASDVDTLHEKVSPSAIASRRTQATKNRLSGIKDRVMGSTHGATSSVTSTGSDVAGSVKQAPSAVRQQTQGNPLAAGVIAFGAGWLVSSLLPSSDKEQQATMAMKDQVQEHSDTLTAPVKEAAQGAKENLQPKAQEAVGSVKSTATDAAGTVKGEAQSAKDNVSGSSGSSTSSY
jgi:ElaB/YqjD/DUF883 family membrane-anchored ribosome-binding protein/uncharacterized protein YjbJ (UPF0337 family)